MEQANPIIKESFLVNYGTLQPVKLFNGSLEGYTSDKLKDFIVKAVKKSSFSGVTSLTEKLISENKIVPVVLNKGFFKAALSKVYHFILDELMIETDAEKRFTFAYYTPMDNKVYLILTNEANILSWIKDENMAYTVFHELMHYAAANELNDFYKIWGNFFVDFYKKFFEKQYKIFTGNEMSHKTSLELKDVIVSYYLKTLRNVDKKLLKPEQIRSLYNSILKIYSTKHKTELYQLFLSNDVEKNAQVEMCFDVMFSIVFNGLTNTNKLYDLMRYHQVRDSINNMTNNYANMNASSFFSKRSFTYQEFFIPSEIAAVSIGSKGCGHLLKSTLQLLD